MKRPPVVRQVFELGRLTQRCQHTYAFIGDHELESTAIGLIGEHARARALRMFMDIRFHLPDRSGQALRDRHGKSHRLGRLAAREQESGPHRIVTDIEWIDDRSQKSAMVRMVKPANGRAKKSRPQIGLCDRIKPGRGAKTCKFPALGMIRQLD
ncbi:MAG TPA: hypothetical protein VMV19_15515 [Xanthobacteraceae bacterium]|nr:hypothetical protein [Xanthobacteraceae bacterium]